MAQPNTFAIGICEIGDCKSCLYSYCCTCCALAESRTYLDGSPFCFNFWQLNEALPAYRWVVRSAYKIGDHQDCWGDVCCSLCCTCCVVNQLYQTTYSKGNPVSGSGGITFNNNPIGKPRYECSMDFCCAWLCPCCVVGTILKDSMGMPWYLGCCCVPFWQARNLTRYHLRLQRSWCDGDGFWCPGDCKEECLCPCALAIITSFIPYAGSLVFYFIQGGYLLGLKDDVSRMRSEPGYMVGYHTPQPVATTGVAVTPAAVLTNNQRVRPV